MNYRREADNILKNYNNLLSSIENLKEDIKIIEEELIDLRAISYDSEIKSSNYFQNDRDINIFYRKKLQEDNLKITKLKVNQINNIFKTMKKTYPKETKLLKCYYVDMIRGEQLENIFNICNRQIYRLKEKALRTFAVNYFGINAIL